MQRRVFLALAVLIAAPTLSQAAITITAGNHVLAPNTAGQVVNVLLNSTGDVYTDGNFRATIADGGPTVTLIFGDPATTIPGGNLAGSIWAGGAGGISGPPNGTTDTSNGLRPVAAFLTQGSGTPQNTSGIYASLTLSTVGVAPGAYAFSLTGHPNGPTDLFNGLDDNLEPIPTDLFLVNGSLTVTPEPSSVVMGLFAAAGLGYVALRRRRARRAA